MSVRAKPKYASRDAHAGPWTVCSDCGLQWSQKDMQFQYDYVGGPTPINLMYLRCPRCVAPLTEQRRLLIIPPDPPPLFNTRPENYYVDEARFLLTEDLDIITTESDVALTPNIPNPQDVAATAHLLALLRVPGGSVATMYLDIFYGNPATGGRSVLSQITGSATRTDVSADLTTVLGIAKNPDQIIVTTSSGATINTNYVGFYSASSGGTLIMSGACAVVGPFVTQGNPVVFDALALQINLNI